MKPNRKASLIRKLQWSIFVGWMITNIATALIFLCYYHLFGKLHYNMAFYIINALIISLILGTILANYFFKKANKHLGSITSVLKQVASGDFTVKIKEPKNLFLKSIVADFNKMVEELSSVQTLRNDFTANFSHEFKTPIVSIHGFAEILLSSPSLSETEKREYLQIIYDESARLANLANNTLLMSRLDSQKLMAEKQYFYLDEQIRQTVLLFEKTIIEKNLQMRIKLDSIHYFANVDLIQQIWINLLSNAVKFCDENAKITINSTITEADIIISIADTGLGMDEVTIKHAFEKYYQGDPAHAVSGNGLGLAIVKRILELVNGSIKITSAKGKGTTITVTFPTIT